MGIASRLSLHPGSQTQLELTPLSIRWVRREISKITGSATRNQPDDILKQVLTSSLALPIQTSYICNADRQIMGVMLKIKTVALLFTLFTVGSASASSWLHEPMKPSARGKGATFTLLHPPIGLGSAIFGCDPDMGLYPVLQLNARVASIHLMTPAILNYTNDFRQGVLTTRVDTTYSSVRVYLDRSSIKEYIQVALEGNALNLNVSISGFSNSIQFTMPTAGLLKQMKQNSVCRAQLSNIMGSNVR